MSCNVLLISSSLKNQGGIISVLKNYLSYEQDDVKFHFLSSHRDGNVCRKYLYFIKALIFLPWILVFNKVDIVHMHVSENGSIWRAIMLFKICAFFKKKVIIHHHAAEFDLFYEACTKKQRAKINKFLEAVTLNIVLSPRLVPMIKNKANNASVVALNNSVYTYSKNMYNSSGNTILFLGRLGKRKGTYDLLDVICDLDSVLPENIRFALCGDGEVDEVKRIIVEKNISKRISHVGWIQKEEKEEIFKDTIINVLPSYNEGLPMTILETMAYGIPNISTNIASIPDVIIDDKTGFLINPGDKKALEDSILLLVNNINARRKISNESFSFIKEHFSIEANFCQLIEIYNNVLEEQ